MGNCIYVRLAYHLGTPTGGPPVVRELPSETWMDAAEAGRELAEGHFLNTTTGVWFYESDLWEKDKLRARLLALVEQVTSPEFLRHYEEWGRQQLDPRTPKLRMLRCRECGVQSIAAIVKGETRDCPKCGAKGAVGLHAHSTEPKRKSRRPKAKSPRRR